MARESDPQTAIIALKLALARADLEPQVRSDAESMKSRLEQAPVHPLQPV